MQPTFSDQGYQMLNLAGEAGVSPETLQALFATGLLSDLLKAENPAAVDREKFRMLLGYDPSVFRTVLGGPETTDEIVAYLKANRFYVNNLITQANFPLTARPAVEEDEIVIHDPGCSFSEKEALAILKREGLLRPTYEHSLRFAQQHGAATTSRNKPHVIFFHQDWRVPDRHRRVLCVSRGPDDRELCLVYPDTNRLRDDCVLAGVRPCK